MLPQQLKLGSKVKNYFVVKELGRGCFGIVYEGINTENQLPVAIKCVSKKLKTSSPKAFQLFQDECKILSQITNDNIVGYVDYFESGQTAYLVIDFCNEGDLDEFVKKQPGKRIQEDDAKQYFKQLLNGIKGLHEHQIIHRDLKLPNILKHDGKLKIADLGFAKQLKSDNSLTGTVLGTPYTMGPEVLEEKEYGMEADMYRQFQKSEYAQISLGVIFYQLLFGCYPFNAGSEYQLIQEIKKQNVRYDFPGVKISQETRELLSRMLKYNREERMTWTEIYNHSVFRENNLFQNVGLQNLGQSKLKLQQNADFYESMDNMHNQKQNQQPGLRVIPEEQKNEYKVSGSSNMLESEIQEVEIDQEEANTLINAQKYRQERINEIKNCIHLYLNDLNITNQIGKTVYKAHTLPETNINTFYPVFFMLKKLLRQYNGLLNSMNNQENTFNCKYPDELFSSELFKDLQNQMTENLEMIRLYFMARQMDMQDLMGQTPNPDVEQELDEQLGPNFSALYQQIMINYYINIQEEIKRCQTYQKFMDVDKFQEHLLEVLDVFNMEKVFKQEKQFDFAQYDTLKDNLNYNNRQQLIEQRLLLVLK